MPSLINIGYLATCRDEGEQKDIWPIRNAAIAWEGDEIVWVGEEEELPPDFATGDIYNADGKMVIPGLIDCHTHLAFGGWRSDEFVMRLKGRSYLQIAEAGGGIMSTVQKTREAEPGSLIKKASGVLQEMNRLGVTTVECKSGYGLTPEEELKLLRVYRELSNTQSTHLVVTFMGAHTVPPEYRDQRRAYIDLVIEQMIPAVAEEGLAEFCDIFVEESAFSVDEAREILVAGQAAGLVSKIHADQLTSCGGAELAAELEAASADHLEQASDEGITAMADAGVVGVTLPIASMYTQQEPLNCRKLIEAGMDVAVATDFNPGSAPSYDLPLAMMLACNQGGMIPAEALKGATIQAAKAINRDRNRGSIQPGKVADFAMINAPDPDFWMYHYRPNACEMTFIGGTKVY